MRCSCVNALPGEAFIPENVSEMLRPEQKSVGTLCEFLQRYSYPGALVVDMFMGTGSTAVACVLLQRKFIGCDIDEECVAASKVRLTDLFDGGSQKYNTLLDAKAGAPVDWRSEHCRNYATNPCCDDKTPILGKDMSDIESAKVGGYVSKLIGFIFI